MADIQFHEMADGRRIAFRHIKGTGPALIFLPGYMSDMEGSKATALFDWAVREGRECLLLDYSGCGRSNGDFAEGTLSRWREEVLSLVEQRIIGSVILVGSSMGGWLMLLVARMLPGRVAGMVGIAAAPDFTEWGFTAEEKAIMQGGETLLRDNPYGPEPTPTHAGFWQDGERVKQLRGIIEADCRVRLLHGQDDDVVPPEISLRLASRLRSDDVQVTLVKRGDHRLSREEDIALLLRTVEALR
ncbi:alpha/beta fold hydrolase [Altericroceibacterium endophyticum]|uniref:Palmitoyl-protein thioesterase ABHD10, mitochondrial n=1 Tax=Altericroceibacterium endophyticum TaxID=1808508 RepID=A0A6I4T7F0_9SPHN|nr:alpha/beta hydrolase [Altericroceibacterium endophyticum]MXO65790.1 alpha/beta fold hydrolase [Altericroceibacterium endophyticum]